MSTSVILQELG